jgi:hypothetical protein
MYPVSEDGAEVGDGVGAEDGAEDGGGAGGEDGDGDGAGDEAEAEEVMVDTVVGLILVSLSGVVFLMFVFWCCPN